MEDKKHTGFVTIIGRPSSGKSTFINTACGEKVSIVSAVPQTTRNAVRGIVNTAESQIVFIDTPGYHSSEKKMNIKLQEIAKSQLSEADAFLYITDATRVFGEEEHNICALLANFQSKLVTAINKTDLPKSMAALTSLSIKKELPLLPEDRIFNISARIGYGIDNVLTALTGLLPTGELLYPPEFYTDQDVSFRITEIIREQAILHTRDEIPHALYATVQDMEMKKNGKELWVRAFLYVERESQKPMVIGKGASLIKAIRVKAMAELRKIFPYNVILDLQVRVDKNWRQR